MDELESKGLINLFSNVEIKLTIILSDMGITRFDVFTYIVYTNVKNGRSKKNFKIYKGSLCKD